MKPILTLLLGAAATLAAVAVDCGPLGAERAISTSIGRNSRMLLDHYEMNGVAARIETGPLRRRVLLTGPADDFQRGEIVRLVEQLPGVGEARWTDSTPAGPFPLPLWIEAALMALAAYAAGATLGYLVELRRRATVLNRF